MKAMRALSLRQPFAEQVMRGTKKFEYRTFPTLIRERVYVYASLGARPREDWRGMGIEPGSLPRGVLIGTVEITGCKRLRDGTYAWALAKPRRLRKPIAPKEHPQPS